MIIQNIDRDLGLTFLLQMVRSYDRLNRLFVS